MGKVTPPSYAHRPLALAPSSVPGLDMAELVEARWVARLEITALPAFSAATHVYRMWAV